MATIIRNSGGGATAFKLQIVVPSGATAVQCYKLNDDGTTTQLYNGDKLEEGWELFTVATPSTIKGNYYVVPQYSTIFNVTVGEIALRGNLEDYSWAEIASLASQGLASSIFNVGDTKEFTCTDGWVGTATLIGFNHDTKTAGGLANLSFDFKYLYKDYKRMNTTNTNSGGWDATEMRCTTLPAILATFPDDIKNNISAVNKSTHLYGEESFQTTSDKLWLHSMTEVGLEDYTYSSPDDSEIYDYYRDGGTSVRCKTILEGSAYSWWTRSPRFYFSNTFCIVNANGSGSYYDSSITYGVVAGFCL